MTLRCTLIAATLLASAPALADVTEEERFSFKLDPGGRISLENVNGDVVVNGEPGSEVEILAIKRADNREDLERLEISVAATEREIRIETKHPKNEEGWFGWNKGSSGSVRYEMRVPSDAELDAIETVNGSIEIRGVVAPVTTSTVNGDLEVHGLAGDLRADTVNGSIDASFDALASGQRVKAESVNGSITLVLPGSVGATVDVETVNGSIDADDFGLEADKGFVGRELDGRIGDGGARISVDTVNGAVRIRKG